jgi:hypothetical protein
MRVESAVTSVSWIPSEAVAGLAKMGFTAGAVRFDHPPPDRITDLAALHAAERFRFANHLAAWVEVRDGKVVGAGRPGPARRTGRTPAPRGPTGPLTAPLPGPQGPLCS